MSQQVVKENNELESGIGRENGNGPAQDMDHASTVR